MTAWLLMFAIQAVLIDRKRTDLHRALGPFAAALAALATIGGLVALYELIVVKHSIDLFSGEFLRDFVAEDGVSLLFFGAFVTAGIIVRRQRDVHNLLMLMATVSLLPPAVLRLVSILAQRLRLWGSLGIIPPPGSALVATISQQVALMVFVIMTSILAVIVAFDFKRKRPTSQLVIWGGAAMVASFAATFYFRTHP